MTLANSDAFQKMSDAFR